MSRRKSLAVDELLKRIGDDPHKLVLAIQLMDRLIEQRRRRSKRRAA